MTRPMLTQREAAAACGVSRTTIRRRREAGDLPGAYEDPKRGWVIPVDDLLAAGFRINAPSPADPAAAPAGPGAAAAGDGQDAAALRAELERVRAEHALALAEAHFGQRLAEAEAEHLRVQLAARAEHIADLQRAVAALTPAPQRPAIDPPAAGPAVPGQTHTEPTPATAAPTAAPAEEETSAPRRRWWGGRA
ncbi:helix-turn-helix domain-containing protein [Streptomyces sp. NPDC032472]|uniref:helix-turn-helix transcriptional regulator n=1 Tax=Streptomyces sp. NPDC032472 TaxID=3155018 RepID=UPI0033C96DCD